MPVEQAQTDLPRREFLPGRGGAELFDGESIADGDFFATVVPPSGSQIRAWNGSSWVTGNLMRWTGSIWQAETLKRWNGSSWVNV
jgi:hypothetical protein